MNQTSKNFSMKNSKITVVIKTIDINSSKMSFKRLSGDIYINGLRSFGIDEIPGEHKKSMICKNMITEISVIWDSKKIKFTERNLHFFFNVPLKWGISTSMRPSHPGNIIFIPSINGDSFILSIGGGDGAASFTAWWVIRKEGVVSVCVEEAL